MGNSGSTSGGGNNATAILDSMSQIQISTNERETTAAWYRYGVAVTDVYDVIEVLGQGHMGEVFTVRRKIHGSHSDASRATLQATSHQDLQALRRQEEKREKRKGTIKGATHKAKKVVRKSIVKKGGEKEESAMDDSLHHFIANDNGGSTTPRFEPPQLSFSGSVQGGKGGAGTGSPPTPAKSSMRRGSKYDVPSLPYESLATVRSGEMEEGEGEFGDSLVRSFSSPPKLPSVELALTPRSTTPGGSPSTATASSLPSTPGSISSLAEPGSMSSTAESGSITSPAESETVSSPAESETTSSVVTLSSSPSQSRSLGLRRKSSRSRGVHFQRTFAVKTILTSRVNKDQVQEMVNEINIMRKLDHPYILKLYEVYHIKRKLWLVTELCTGGDLSSRKLNEHQVKNAVEQILRALGYLHRIGIVHRDIKLENVLYENHAKDASIRLIDFGLSKTFESSHVVGGFGRTPYTMSPEQVTASTAGGTKLKEDCVATSAKMDIWAVGIITWIMLSGDFPFVKTSQDLKNPELLNKLKKAKYRFGVTWGGRGITPGAKEFVAGCLQMDPQKRWSAKEALDNLQKVWAPPVDTIWGAWQKEQKNRLRADFVGKMEEDDAEVAALEAKVGAGEAGTNGSSGGESSSDGGESGVVVGDGAAPVFVDKQDRASLIKIHVKNTLKEKDKERFSIVKEEETVGFHMDDVERYTKFGLMKKTMLLTMANTMDRNDVGRLREIFLEADTLHSGTITLEELKGAFHKISPGTDEAKVENLFVGIDRDGSGHIHYAEFLAALAESHGLVTLDRLTEAFDRIDTDGKGYITHDDLKSILGRDYCKDKVNMMIEEGDFKKNNKIDYEELLKLMFDDPVKGDVWAGTVSQDLLDH